MFYMNSEIQSDPAGERITRKVLAYEKDMMLVEVTFEPNSVGADHSHPHKQISYVTKGEVKYRLGDEIMTLRAGDSVFVAPNVIHGSAAGSDGAVLLDVFTPMREDFIK